MKHNFEKRISFVLVIVTLVLCIAIGIPVMFTQCQVTTSQYDQEITVPVFTAVTHKPVETTSAPEETEPQFQVETAKVEKNNKNTTAVSDQKATNPNQEATETIPFATAAKGENKVSYESQWNRGYLVAVDYPDTSYRCPHIELSDENRDVLERLCMGEFSVGGFTGAALIAQAVKNAMATYGYTDVRDVIRSMHYTGKLGTKPSGAVKKAVIYVFDMDKDAIQHRILYMYNPELTQSRFHESQDYICTYKDVRFFDR